MSKKQIISAFLVLSFLISPTITNAEPVSAPFCFTFNNNIIFGATGNDVDNLITALKAENLLSTTPTSLNYDVYLAVKSFQVKYKILKYGTGFVGPLTRAELNKIYSCGTEVPKTITSSIIATSNRTNSFSASTINSSTGVALVYEPPVKIKTYVKILAELVQMLRDHTCADIVNVAPHCDENFDFNSDGKTASHEVLVMQQIHTTSYENFDNAYKDIMSAIDERMNLITTDAKFESAFDTDRDNVITQADKNRISFLLIASRVYPVVVHKTDSEILAGLVQMLRDHTCAALVNVAPHCDVNFDFNSDGKTASHEVLIMLQILTTNDENFDNAYKDIMAAIDARMNKINTDENFESAFDIDRDNVITPFDKNKISEVLIGSRVYPAVGGHTPRRNPSDTGPIIIDTVPKPVIIHKTNSEILADLVQMLRDHTCAALVNVAPHCDENFDFNSDGKTASHEALVMLQIHTTSDQSFENAYTDIMSAIDARMNKINTDENFESAFDIDRDNVITPFDKNKISEVLIGSRTYPQVVMSTTFSSGFSGPIEDTQTETTNSEIVEETQSETTTETIDEKKEEKLEETANAEAKKVEEVVEEVVEKKVDEVVVEQKTEVEAKAEVEVKIEEPVI